MPKNKKILIYCDNFYPLQGGAEIHLERLISSLIDDGYKPEVLTLFPEILGEDREFDYPVTRLITEKIHPDSIKERTLSEVVWGSGQVANSFVQRSNEGDSRPDWYVLIDMINNYVEHNSPYHAYIGCGQFGAKQVSFMADIVEGVKKQNPSCKTFYLDFDVYHYANPNGKLWGGLHIVDVNPMPHIDYLMSLNHHDLTHEKISNKNVKICLPPFIEDKPIISITTDEWESRPYDFGFLSPLYHKGTSIVKNLLIEFPDAKFLIKKPTYGSSFDLDIIYPILGDNYDSIKWFDNIEEDFYQKCKFVLYPSLNEGYGLVPVEAIMDGAIPILNYTQSNYWVHHNNVYYINNELNNNPDLYNFDYYLKNYDLINEQWVVELKDILNKDTRHHIQFVTDTQKKVVDYHQNRYNKLYSKFKKILEE